MRNMHISCGGGGGGSGRVHDVEPLACWHHVDPNSSKELGAQERVELQGGGGKAKGISSPSLHSVERRDGAAATVEEAGHTADGGSRISVSNF